MVRTVSIKNAKIRNAIRGIGGETVPLTDKQYDELVEMVELIKDISKDVKFDESSDIIFGRLPDNKGPELRQMRDGTDMHSVPVIVSGGRWASFLTDDEELVLAVESAAGAPVAIVGKLVEKKGETTSFWNIVGYRGMIIMPEGDPTSEADSVV